MFLFVTRLIVYLGPFLAALAITLIINRPVDAIQKKLKIKRGLATAVVLLLFVISVGGGLGFLFYRLFDEVFALAHRILTGYELEQYLESFFERLRILYANLPMDAEQAAEDAIASLAANVTAQAQVLLERLFDFALSLPRIIIFIVISLVATFFMTKDKEKILYFFSRQVPELWRRKMEIVARELIRTILVYIKSQAITSSITFVAIFIGYSLLGLEYVLLFALFTTLFDALPVLGAGMVLGTSAFVQLVMGDFLRGIGFIGIYLVVLMIRNSVEPKVIGKGVGIHPLLILLSMYTGLQLIGAIGLILGPIFVIIIRALQKAQLLPDWKK
jgi:sporulation integral membrane protein YtvI